MTDYHEEMDPEEFRRRFQELIGDPVQRSLDRAGPEFKAAMLDINRAYFQDGDALPAWERVQTALWEHGWSPIPSAAYAMAHFSLPCRESGPPPAVIVGDVEMPLAEWDRRMEEAGVNVSIVHGARRCGKTAAMEDPAPEPLNRRDRRASRSRAEKKHRWRHRR